ncbi:DUF2218 domain-containing protein [Isoptericola haloaureus]|uniref:DUF2218 domain-containing protein n=1 Tax=Isoptericola haloaureus TaxID=1542902 RepID=A0ABU7Z6W6_9MICO
MSVDDPTAEGTFVTDDGARYVKQLASHLGRRSTVETDGDVTTIRLTVGQCTLTVAEREVRLHAVGDDDEGLETVRRVVGGHLERFAQRRGLTVDWA